MKIKQPITEAQTTTMRSTTSALRRSFIQFHHVQRLLEKMEDLLSQDITVEEADNLFIVGESGVGKSWLLKKFLGIHPHVKHDDYTEIPVLYTSVPSKSSIDDLASAMLLSMGSPFWNRGKTKDLTAQLYTLLKACRVRMIILDEVNHLVDKGGVKTHYLLADWLKLLTEEARIPIVLAGIPRATRLLETNEQFRGRFREVVPIKPFSVEDDRLMAEFQGVMKAFKGLIPELLKVDISGSELTHRFAFASAGRLREIRRLLVRVVELAYRNSSGQATLQTFAAAFKEIIYPGASDERNPFTDKFNQVPLTRPGEPFAPRVEA